MFYGLKHWNLPGKKRESECLEGFNEGSPQAYSRLYERYHKPIASYVNARISDREVAEDLTQEIFLKVHRHRESYCKTHPFSAWIWAIAKNSVYDHLRATRNRRDATGAASVLGQLSLDHLPSPQQNAEHALMEKERWRIVFKLTKPLTRAQRRVLWLRVVRQLPYTEISQRMGLSLSAVKNLALRAKHAMTKRLEGIGGLPDLSCSIL